MPFSCSETWICNHERIPDRALRNANDYYIPQPRIELVKRLPLFAFPSAWNSEDNEKYTPSQPIYLKYLKKKHPIPAVRLNPVLSVIRTLAIIIAIYCMI